MKRGGRTAGLLLGLLFVGGCYRMAVLNGEPVPFIKDKKAPHHGIYSLVEISQVISLNEVCPSGFARIDEQVSFVNGLLSGLTNGVYTPSTVFVQCKDGAAHFLERDGDGQGVRIIDSAPGETPPLGG